MQDTESDGAGLVVDKNINNTPHKYEAVEGDAAIKKLVAELKKHDEICFDTETTGIDANDAELVGLSFSVKPGKHSMSLVLPIKYVPKKSWHISIPSFPIKRKYGLDRIPSMIC